MLVILPPNVFLSMTQLKVVGSPVNEPMPGEDSNEYASGQHLALQIHVRIGGTIFLGCKATVLVELFL